MTANAFLDWALGIYTAALAVVAAAVAHDYATERNRRHDREGD